MDKKRSRHDKVGHNIAQQNMSIEKCESPGNSQEKDNDDKTMVAEKEERMGVLLTTIYKEFSTNLEPSTADKERLLNLMAINDQRIHFVEEYDKFRLGKPIGKDSNFFKLNPFYCMKDKTIKTNTRQARADVFPKQVKYSKILSKEIRLSELIVIHNYVKNAHVGPHFTQRAVSNKF